MTQSSIAFAPDGSGLPCGPDADYFTLSGDRSPGLATIEDGDAEQGWDVRKGYALSWATIVPAGEELTTLVIRIDLWTASHYAAWLVFAAKYLARPAPAQPGTTQPKSYGFRHVVASAQPYNIVSVVVRKVTMLKQTEPGKFSALVYLLEWKRPLPAQARPEQSTPAAEQDIPTATTRTQAEILDATATLNALGADPGGAGGSF